MTNKPLTNQQLFDLAVGAFGIQFASSLMMTNMSSVFKFFNVAGGNLPYLWLAAPVSGLLIQPLIGQLSDDTLTRYGKRRPYLFIWCLITVICFSLIPLTQSLWMMMVLFWGIGCGVNGMTEALRALIGDITLNPQKTQAFSWQTIFAGMGATLAAVSPYLLSRFVPSLCSHMISFNAVPCAMLVAFVLSGIVLLTCVLWTLHRIKEKHISHIEMLHKHHQSMRKSIAKKIKYFLPQLLLNIKKLPLIVRQLLMVQLFTWVGLYSMWLYFTLAIAQHHYGLPVNIETAQDPHYAAILEKSTIKTDIYFGIYQFISIICAICLPFLIKKTSPKCIHAVCLLIGAAGLILIALARTEWMMVIAMLAVGVLWGSIMTMPYAMVSAGVPRSKMGVYLGIFNITITVPQIISGLLLGFVYTVIFRHHAMGCILLAGISVLIAGGLLWRQNQRERLC